MTNPDPATYLEEAAVILRKALKSAEDRYVVNVGRNTPEDRRELMEARVRIAEAFARLHEADHTGTAAPKGQDPEDSP